MRTTYYPNILSLFVIFFITFSSENSYALTKDESKHLLRRTSFTVRLDLEEKVLRMNRKDAASFLVNLHENKQTINDPLWLDSFKNLKYSLQQLKRGKKLKTISNENIINIKKNLKQLLNYFPHLPKKLSNKLLDSPLKTKEEKKAFFMSLRKFQKRFITIALQAWWINNMETTKSPLTEKMTLFWHNHFVSEMKKVKNPTLILNQNKLLRKHALGKFEDFLNEITLDPAMLIYLDGVKNVKSSPNENFARELLELFTLGEGNYTEGDIKAIAKALTGYKYNPKLNKVLLRKKLHDKSAVTIFNKTGLFTPEKIIKLILEKNEAGTFLVNKLWKEFISPTPDPATVKVFAYEFTKSNYDIKSLMVTILSSDAFYNKKNRGSLIKSPVELVLLAKSQFKINIKNPSIIPRAIGNLGQVLFNPPNVKGWPGGKSWITTASLTTRRSVIARITDGGMRNMGFKMKNIDKIFKNMSITDVQAFLLPIPPISKDDLPQSKTHLAKVLTNDPVYQLK